jgi:hypothetical protein
VTKHVILNSQAHRNLRVDATPSARLGDNQRFVPVVINEFPFLVPHYPIFFSKDADTGAFYCGAMLGFDEGENLFLDDGRDSYRPLHVQRGPFVTVGADLAIDLENPRVGQNKGERLFTEGGETTPYLESVKSLFRELYPGIERTKVFIAALLELKLVEPVDLNVGFDDATQRTITGLYTVDQQALRELPDEKIVELFRRGYLQLIYLMIASLKQVPVLGQKKNRRLRQ